MKKINLMIFELYYIDDEKLNKFINNIDKNKFNVELVIGFYKKVDKKLAKITDYLYGENLEDVINKISNYIRIYKPDYVISFDCNSNFVINKSNKYKKTSYIYGDFEVRSNFERKINMFNLKNRMRLFFEYNFSISKIVVLNQNIKNDLIKNYFIFPYKVKVINKDDILCSMKKKKFLEQSHEKIRWEYFNRPNVVDYIEHGGIIGNGCEIFPQVHFGSEPYLIKIGNNVRITDGVKFLTHDGGMWTLRKTKKEMKRADYFGSISIGDNTHIGWNTIIMPNVKIGKNCVIGCGCIVTHDIPDNSVAVGVPARVLETIDEYYHKHKDNVYLTNHLDWQQKRKVIEKEFKNKKYYK